MSRKLRVVFDTNIFISAIIFGGNSRLCLNQAREGRITLVTSKSILLELARKLYEKFGWSEEEIKEVIQAIGTLSSVVEPKARIGQITVDPPDNRVLEAAVEVKADFIVSGDKHHLLPLRLFRDIRILSPRDFLKVLSS